MNDCSGLSVSHKNNMMFVGPIQQGEKAWRRSNTYMFVLLLKPHRLLWDPNHVEYNNVKARCEVLSEIARDMRDSGMTPSFLERKLEALRTIYKRELLKTLKDLYYQTRVKWFKFVDTFMRESVIQELDEAKVTWKQSIAVSANKYIIKKNKSIQKKIGKWKREKYSCGKRERLYRLACLMVINELLEEQEQKETAQRSSLMPTDIFTDSNVTPYSRNTSSTPINININNTHDLNDISSQNTSVSSIEINSENSLQLDTNENITACDFNRSGNTDRGTSETIVRENSTVSRDYANSDDIRKMETDQC